MAQKVIGIDCMFSGSIVEIPQNEGDGFTPGDSVVYKDEDGKEEFGKVKYIDAQPFDLEKVLITSKILRPATPNDMQKMESHVDQSGQSLEKCQELVAQHALDMQVFRAGISFDGTKVHFMFTADERVDFREMVKDLAKAVKKQIYLRQVGPRDKAKIIGGFGKCGRTLCCSSFLNRLESISMDMVRDQGLESKGSSKLSGSCGKLLCCLKYEVNTYRKLKKSIPDIGSIVKLKKSVVSVSKQAQVVGFDILNQKVKVLTEEREFLIISVEEIEKVVKTPESRGGSRTTEAPEEPMSEESSEEEKIKTL